MRHWGHIRSGQNVPKQSVHTWSYMLVLHIFLRKAWLFLYLSSCRESSFLLQNAWCELVLSACLGSMGGSKKNRSTSDFFLQMFCDSCRKNASQKLLLLDAYLHSWEIWQLPGFHVCCEESLLQKSWCWQQPCSPVFYHPSDHQIQQLRLTAPTSKLWGATFRRPAINITNSWSSLWQKQSA